MGYAKPVQEQAFVAARIAEWVDALRASATLSRALLDYAESIGARREMVYSRLKMLKAGRVPSTFMLALLDDFFLSGMALRYPEISRAGITVCAPEYLSDEIFGVLLTRWDQDDLAYVQRVMIDADTTYADIYLHCPDKEPIAVYARTALKGKGAKATGSNHSRAITRKAIEASFEAFDALKRRMPRFLSLFDGEHQIELNYVPASAYKAARHWNVDKESNGREVIETLLPLLFLGHGKRMPPRWAAAVTDAAVAAHPFVRDLIGAEPPAPVSQMPAWLAEEPLVAVWLIFSAPERFPSTLLEGLRAALVQCCEKGAPRSGDLARLQDLYSITETADFDRLAEVGLLEACEEFAKRAIYLTTPLLVPAAAPVLAGLRQWVEEGASEATKIISIMDEAIQNAKFEAAQKN